MSCLVLWLLLAAGMSSAANLRSLPDLMTDVELMDHVRRITRAVEAEEYDIATLYGTSLYSGEHTGLTKRDVEDHASHPSTESRNFELHLTSGERLRMSVQKRSAMSPDVTVVERVSGREELRRPQVRDCFFSGGLEGEEGHASLSLCDGQVMGAIRSRKRDFELHALPETTATRRRSVTEPLRVLVTWSNSEQEKRDVYNIVPEIPDESQIYSNQDTHGGRSVADKSATIEVGVYLDRLFLANMEGKFGLSTTQQLTDLVALKWSGMYAVLSNPSVIGWKITMKVVYLEIWRETPSWYNETVDNLGGRMDNICMFTTDKPFDHIMLETADTPGNTVGLSWQGTMCNPRWRCSIAKGVNLNNWIEIHETGHSIGLNHDNTFTSCDPNVPKGFMSMQETVFRDCYAPVLDSSLRTKTCLFEENVDASKYTSVKNIVPLYRGQRYGLDSQCQFVQGDGFQYLHRPSADTCAGITCIRKSPFREIAEMKTFMGTPCGKEQMCFEGACVPWVKTVNPNYVRPLVKEGGWGPWSSSSPCDNTCGDAVSVSTRQCNSPVPSVAPFCKGDVIKAQMCPSRQACSGESSVESELVQQRVKAVCSKVKASGGSSYSLTGEGKLNGTSGEVSKCTATCNHVDGTSTTLFALQDGTPCWGQDNDRNRDSNVRGISWRCVQGRCLAFGCNGKSLGEGGGVEKDRCGVCGGNGSSCRK
ncbi:A disintegrin and metalloproteinase with thrombospondin motifs adt-2-like isoform X1 [Pomacea canaliculata]|uniref:A disintegrin and metalloproteinase with thrombospondin motifs adt-2-like isoform X1 n=1 Tax=Pomacea canaliculata TaxID=400727 RepID=UPI000D732AE0|nr:A disintegrin and metalloproteinase with thrombospondin motifs adt-2-like isoform X1 [Pomacea canaliculata]